MLITLKNKGFLTIDDFIFKCAIGKNGIKLKKKKVIKQRLLENFL